MAVLGLRCCEAFSLIAAARGYSSLQCEALLWPLTVVASHCRAQLLGCTGFSSCSSWLNSCSSWALEHRLNNCGAWTRLLCSIWNLSQPGIKSTSPALAGRFFTTEPPEAHRLISSNGK